MEPINRYSRNEREKRLTMRDNMLNMTSEIVLQIIMLITVARSQNTLNNDDENKILISDGQNHSARNFSFSSIIFSFSCFPFSLSHSFSSPIDCVYGCLPVHMYASVHIFSFCMLSFRRIAYIILYYIIYTVQCTHTYTHIANLICIM